MTSTDNLQITHIEVSQADKEGAINNIADNLDRATMGRLQHDMASDADYTLLTVSNEHINLYLQIDDTGVVLTAARNIILPNNRQIHIAFNNTAQTLTFKTVAGSGVAVQAGSRDIIYTDGTDVVSAVGLAADNYPQDYHWYFPNKPPNNALIGFIVMTRTVEFVSGLTGSYGESVISATASTDFDIKKNGSSIGTINWAAAATSATFTFASTTSFSAGDELKVFAPATQDSTLSGISISLKGSRFV